MITKDGFVANEFDRCLYSKMIGNEFVLLCVYVDDIFIFSKSLSNIVDVKNYLGNMFDVKDLGEADVILGMKIFRSEKGIHLSLSHLIESVLKKYNYFDYKPVSTPYSPNVPLKKNIGKPVT